MRDIDVCIVETMKYLIQTLVAGDYARLEQYSSGKHLSEELLRESVSTYGAKLIAPPEQAFECIEAIELIQSSPRRWAIDFDLWTEEEGHSDLTLQCTLFDTGSGNLLPAEINGIHVL